jgi:hypothetical protein
VDERAQSRGMVHGARGDSFMAEAVSREKGGGPRCRGSKERGGWWRGRDVWIGGQAPDGQMTQTRRRRWLVG